MLEFAEGARRRLGPRWVVAFIAVSALACDEQASGPGLEPPVFGGDRGGIQMGGTADDADGTSGFGGSLPAGGSQNSVADAGTSVDGGDASTDAAADAGDAASVVPPDGGASSDAAVDCDPRHVVCADPSPTCGVFEVPRVDGDCYGPCVPIERCGCSEPEACPEPNHHTCHNFRQRCGPYL